ncbi:DDE superfamily endonuclease-domain-containing protein [Thamnidium elegans]|nr:DDE superfamily endonuclease-domain-containing protein [Thamnidium elegans]
MNNNMDFEYLSFNEQDNSDELTAEVTVSLMSMMRAKYEYGPAAMEIDVDLTEEFSHEETDLTVKQSSETSDEKENVSSEHATKDKIEEVVTLVTEQVSVKDAALDTGITVSTAYRFKKQWEELGTVPLAKKRGPGKGTGAILTEAHSLFIISIVNSYAPTTLEQMRYRLLEAYPELKISKTAFYNHVRQHCVLSFKRLEKLPEKRNSEEVKLKRRETVLEWMATKDIDFEKNCVFLDEAGFNPHISRSRGWSKKGKPAKSIVPTSRGTSITILGAISAQGVIDISLRKPITVVGSKKRKGDGTVVTTTARIGTRTEHYLGYLSNVMDVLDKNNLKGNYIVMNNAPIHKPATVRKSIEDRGYKCLYLPP